MEGEGRQHEGRYLYYISIYGKGNKRTRCLWIVLVTQINGKKYAKAHVAGWNDISYQKLNARAVVDAIQCMKKASGCTYPFDNAYAEHMIEKRWCCGKCLCSTLVNFF